MFIAALALVLESFPRSVVDYVSDPRTGVVAEFPMGLPNVGQVRELCERVQRRQETMRRDPLPRRPHAPYERLTEPGARANLFIGTDCAIYAEACQYAETADPVDWRYGQCTNQDGEVRTGIWINLYWRGDRPRGQVMEARSGA